MPTFYPGRFNYEPYQPTPRPGSNPFRFTVPPTEPTASVIPPEFNYMREYEKLAKKGPGRLAYEELVNQGVPEIQRGKWAKLGAMLGGIGTTLGTGDPEAGTRAGLAAYYAPQIRARDRYKEKLEGMGNIANMEDRDLRDRLAALEAQRRDYYDQRRDVREEASDKREDRLSNIRFQNEEERLEASRWMEVEDKTDGYTYLVKRDGSGERRKIGKTEFTTDESIQNAVKAEVAKRAAAYPFDVAADERERVTRKEVAEIGAKSRENVASINATARQLGNAKAILDKARANATGPNATEQWKQMEVNLRMALVNDPTLGDYIKEDPVTGFFIPKTAADFIGGNVDEYDKSQMEKVRAALLGGAPAAGGGNEAGVQAGELKWKDVPRNKHDNSIVMTNAQGVEENKSIQSLDWWLDQPGYKIKGYTVLVGPDNVERAVPDNEVRDILQKVPGVKIRGGAPSTTPAAPQASTTSVPAAQPAVAPSVQQPSMPAPQSGIPSIGGNQIQLTPPSPPPTPTTEVSQSDEQFLPLDQPLSGINLGRPTLNMFGMSPLARSGSMEMPGQRLPPPTMGGPVNLLPGRAPAPPTMPMPQPGMPPIGGNPIQLTPPPSPGRVPQAPPALAPAPSAGRILAPLPVNRMPPPAGNIPLARPPAPPAPITSLSGVDFGPTPRPTPAPFGRTSPLSSELTNPISLSKGFMSRPAGPSGEETFNNRFNKVREKFRKETGLDLKVIRGKVTAEEQAKEYEKGRTSGSKQPIRTKRSGKPGEESVHQFGEGADVVFSRGGKVIKTWDDTPRGAPTKDGQRLYDLLGRIAQEEGLEWGGGWKDPDWGHVQLPEVKRRP